MEIEMKKFLSKSTILCTIIFMSINLGIHSHASTLSNKDYKIIEINEEFKLIKPIGLVWVNPYVRSDGTSVRGHYRTSPDGYCWNNFSGCR